MWFSPMLAALGAITMVSMAQDSASQTTETQVVPAPSTTGLMGPCATIQITQSNWPDGTPVQYDAGTAWSCMQSIPLNTTDAHEYLKYAQEYLVFISDLGWLKSPPASYQRPSIDVLSTLNELSGKIDSNAFSSQLDLDLALLNLTVNTRNFHNNVIFGVLGMFTFTTNFSVVSLSTDGSALPQIFLYEDIIKSGSGTGGEGQKFNISAVKSLGGQDPVQYLRNFTTSNQQEGYIEEHAEWNKQMMNSVLRKNDPLAPSFNSSSIYNGDSVSVVLENGTSFTSKFWASSGYNFQPFNTLSDIYSSLVLNLTAGATAAPTTIQTAWPTPTDVEGFGGDSEITTTAAAEDSLPSKALWPNKYSIKYLDESRAASEPLKQWGGPYPANPISVQDDLGVTGFVTGYTLDDNLAVLSLPSFDAPGSGNQTIPTIAYSNTVGDFITKATKAGAQRVVIDLQANGGGKIFLGYEIFKRFFPDITPFGGTTLRASPQANSIGTTYTSLCANSTAEGRQSNSLFLPEPFNAYENLAGNSTMYTSWSQAAGPDTENGDAFTETIRYNCSNSETMYYLSGKQLADLYGYGSRPANGSAPWDPRNIILLTDGRCGSTCSNFAEMMKTEVGVRRVVMGGLPSTGPMQAVSGTRGHEVNEISDILGLSNRIKTSLPAIATNLPEPTAAPRIVGQGSFRVNIENNVRRQSGIPIQYIYEAADCRLWYTPEMMTDYTVLWRQAAYAMFNDSSICVKDSTNQPTSKPNVTSTDSPNGTTTSSPAPSGTGPAPSATTTGAATALVAKGAFAAFVAMFASVIALF